MPELTPESLALWLAKIEEQRKALPSTRKIENAAGFYQGELFKLANGTLKLTEEKKSKLLAVLLKYNF